MKTVKEDKNDYAALDLLTRRINQAMKVARVNNCDKEAKTRFITKEAEGISLERNAH